MSTPLLVRFLMWGMLIFAVSVASLGLRAFRSFELKIVQAVPPFRVLLKSSPQSKSDLPVVPLQLWGQVSNEAYLEYARIVAGRLRKAGARAVIVPLPHDLIPVPRTLRLLAKIASENIVVFSAGSVTGSPYSPRSPRVLEDPRNWWVRHPGLHRVNLAWGVSSLQSQPFGTLFRFVPNEYRDFDTGETVPDVSLQALKRFLGYPDSLEVRHTPYFDFLGPYSIPLESDGYAYAKHSFNVAYRQGVYAFVQPETDSLSFLPIRWSGRKEAPSLDSAWSFYRDKLVILDWGYLSQYQFPSFGSSYTHIIYAILTGNFVDRQNTYDLFWILLVVILLSIVSYHVRGFVAVVLSALISAGMIVLSVWMFDQYSVLWDPLYVLFPVLLCGIILPIVKLAEEKRMLLEKIGSLEQEKKRLEGLRHSQPPAL